MTRTRLHDLLPAALRRRDAEQGGPLADLLGLIDDQVARLEEDLAQLYDDQFIETCDASLIPYIGDLIGHRSDGGAGSPRAEVARTLGYRRRKGTAAVLRHIAHDVTGWPAVVVEFFQHLATSQHLTHLRPHNHYAPDLRDPAPLARLGTAFQTTATTVDLRPDARGLDGVGAFLWRLRAVPLRRVRALSMGDGRRFVLHPLGRNLPLYSRAAAEDELGERPRGLPDVPGPIARRELHDALAAYYGPGKSVQLRIDGVDVPREAIAVSDLSDGPGPNTWARMPRPGRVALDPALGRVAVASEAKRVEADLHLGIADELGAGPWLAHDTTADTAIASDKKLKDSEPIKAGSGTLELTDSASYAGLTLTVAAGRTLTLRAAEGACPRIGGDLTITGEPGGEVILVGLTIKGQLVVPADARLARLTLRACTLVPGHNLKPDGAPDQPGTPSLVVAAPGLAVALERCITGSLRAVDTARLRLRTCVVDATARTRRAYAAPDDGPGAPLTLEQCTVIGTVHALAFDLVSNSILLAELGPIDTLPAAVVCARRQIGCVRFSFVPLDALVPRRFRCQPSSPESARRLEPQFTSLRPGDPAYLQLSPRCPDEIRRGADDESEMGVYHDLLLPRIEQNLRARLGEYLRLGLRAAVFFPT